MTKLARLACAMVAAVLVTTVGGTGTAAAGSAHGGIVGAVPAASTPHVLDNKVLDIEQVGNRIVVAGSFRQVRDAASNGGATWAQSYVFAFDPATGRIDRAFAPQVGGVVNTVLAGPNGTVYLGGTFASLNGTAARNLVNVSLSTGLRSGFRAPAFNGAVNDLALTGGRLFVGGVFNTAGGVRHAGLATLNPVTGALDEYVGVDVTVNANWPATTGRAAVGVSKMDVSPDGARLVAIGNFRYADGLTREQVVVLLLQPTTATVDPNWRTQRYEPTCNTNFDTYVRDVDFSPGGAFFVVVTTGAGVNGTLCDTAARWDVATTGQAVQPAWTAFTGGDTLLAVAVTDAAVYAGGHQRWMNNPLGIDAARPGAVPRPGIAALDPRTGVPLAWNPGRNPRGHGAEALLATESGLYVGMDTEYFGNNRYLRPRLGYFPLAEGGPLPSENARELPAQVFLAGRTTTPAGASVDDVRSRSFDGTTAGADTTSVTPGTTWSRARGAFLVGNTLFYGYPGTGGAYYLFRRTFDGTTYGPPTQIDPYNDPFWSTVSAGRQGGTGPVVYYRGMVPSFYGQLPSVTAMAYRDGRLYYTLSGYSNLYYRYFSVDSGVVSETAYVAATGGFDGVSGLILSRDELYVASATTGELRRTAFVGGVPSGTSTVVSGPARDGRDWRTRAMFLGPLANQAPTAAFTSACQGLVCTFDGRGSGDADGRIVSHAWDFGDGTTGTGATPSRTYGSAGTRTVRLTVTDDRGATASVTRSVSVEAPPAENLPPEAVFTSSCAGLVCTVDAGGSIDRDGSITGYAWDFGDGTTGAGRTAQHEYAAAGDQAITLTVTDDDGATTSATSTVPVATAPPAEGIGLRGSAGTATGTVATASVAVPDSVRAGDGLVLVLSTNSTATGTAPTGFTQAASLTVAGLNPTTQVFSRVAGNADAGSRITVTLSASAKVTLQLLAYSGTSATGPIASATLAGSASGTAHTTPRVQVSASGSWVVSVWSDKQAAARSWTPPPGVAERGAVGGVGNGDIATLVTDSGAPVAAGQAGGLTATVPTASNRAATATIVLAPAG